MIRAKTDVSYLEKNLGTGAVINVDYDMHQIRKVSKMKMKNDSARILSLEKEVSDMKKLLNELINKGNI